jgi:hypothetical protein
MHPFDLATNKVLALVGRLEARDWVDLISCGERIQRLGYLAWAACGKDPGFSPSSILAGARRSGRYSSEEVAALDFEGTPPDASALARTWHRMLEEADEIVAALPAAEAGNCVVDRQGALYSAEPREIPGHLGANRIAFHRGSIRGSFPQIVKPG